MAEYVVDLERALPLIAEIRAVVGRRASEGV